MSRLSSFVVSALTIFAVACGGDGLGGNDPGAGSNTLTVRVDVEAASDINNADSPDQFATDFDVSVSRNGVPVTDATVIIESEVGEVALVHDADGDYVGNQTGYHRSYRLDIEAGDDFLRGVIVTGPSIHVFNSPLAGATVDGTVDLVVEWRRDGEADITRLETREMDPLQIEDSGNHTLPNTVLRRSTDQTEEDRVRIVRENRLVPDGVLGDSSFSVSVRNQVGILVTPDPAAAN